MAGNLSMGQSASRKRQRTAVELQLRCHLSAAHWSFKCNHSSRRVALDGIIVGLQEPRKVVALGKRHSLVGSTQLWRGFRAQRNLLFRPQESNPSCFQWNLDFALRELTSASAILPSPICKTFRFESLHLRPIRSKILQHHQHRTRGPRCLAQIRQLGKVPSIVAPRQNKWSQVRIPSLLRIFGATLDVRSVDQLASDLCTGQTSTGGTRRQRPASGPT